MTKRYRSEFAEFDRQLAGAEKVMIWMIVAMLSSLLVARIVLR